MAVSLMPVPSFDELSRLAHDDPAAFEALRHELVEDYISHAPHRLEHRLRGLQFRIDGCRRLAHSDYGAALRVYNMMWESFESLARLWSELPADVAASQSPRRLTGPQSAIQHQSTVPATPRVVPAQVIPFVRPHNDQK